MIFSGLFEKIKHNRKTLYTIIFEADTRAGKLFDITLIWSIVISVFIVILESVHLQDINLRIFFAIGEWVFTILFTIEYILRLYIVRKKLAYAFSFYGIIDLLSILPTFLSLILPGAQNLMDIRMLKPSTANTAERY